MLITGIIVTFILGYLIVNAISSDFSWTEKIGLSFPLGLGSVTMLMLIYDAASIPLTAMWLLAGIVAVAAALIAVLIVRRRGGDAGKEMPRISLTGYNLVWLAFIALIVYFEYMNFMKCMYFPTFDRDSLAWFDTIGYVIANEHTFRGAVLLDSAYMPHIHDAGSYITYAPMVQLGYAFVYILGAETSKIVPGLMFMSLLVAFYGATRRVSGRTAAAVCTFIMMVTPEMIAFSSMSATNVIHAFSASMGVIYVALWLKYKSRRDLYMASVLLGMNIWTRTDGIVFILASSAVVFVEAVRHRDWHSLIPMACSVLPAVVWVLYCKLFHLYSESIAILSVYWDPVKSGVIWNGLKALFTDTVFYGWTFAALLLVSMVNIWNIIKTRDNVPLLCIFLLSAILYGIALYQVDYKWDSISNVLAYSAKRFLFCFVPIAWYISFTDKWVVGVFGKLDRLLS